MSIKSYTVTKRDNVQLILQRSYRANLPRKSKYSCRMRVLLLSVNTPSDAECSSSDVQRLEIRHFFMSFGDKERQLMVFFIT